VAGSCIGFFGSFGTLTARQLYRLLTVILVTVRLARRFLDRRNVMLPITHDRWGKMGSVLSKAYKLKCTYTLTLSISVSTGLGGFVSGMIGGNFTKIFVDCNN